jgi:hypothetical protein
MMLHHEVREANIWPFFGTGVPKPWDHGEGVVKLICFELHVVADSLDVLQTAVAALASAPGHVRVLLVVTWSPLFSKT